MVSDIGLPGEDGYALIQRVRALPGDAALVPTIALTAYSDPASTERIRLAGFQRHLGKPIALVETPSRAPRDGCLRPSV